MTTDFNDAMTAANAAAIEASTIRKETLPVAKQACRAIETALKAALDGEPLRGLKNIGTNGVVLYAARIRADHTDNKVPHPSSAGSAGHFLVLNQDGELALVSWDSDDLVEISAEDQDLRIDDVSGITNALRVVLPRHVKSAKATNKRYREVYALALKLIEVLGETS